MPMDRTKYRLIKGWPAVESYLNDVTVHADSASNALGFFPASAYEELGYQGKLIVALDDSSAPSRYVGHLLFGGAWPHTRIFQTYVAPQYRRQGVGRSLVTELLTIAEAEQRSSVKARVAADLPEAGAFYGRLGFTTAKSTVGGRTRGRTIDIRVRELDVPDLFRLANPPTSLPDLRLDAHSATGVPYVLDVNVLFDVLKGRDRGNDAGLVIRAGLQNIYRIAVTAEFVAELERNSLPGRDPALELARQLPILIDPSTSVRDALAREIAPIVFPDRYRANRLTAQDASDIRHIAAAISHGVAGFVTSEKAVLRAGERLRQLYALDVVSLSELAETLRLPGVTAGASVAAHAAGFELSIRSPTDSDLIAVERLLVASNIPRQELSNALSPGLKGDGRVRLVVATSEQAVAYAAWTPPRGPQSGCNLFLCADEDHPTLELAVEHILDRAEMNMTRQNPTLIRLSIRPGHAATRRVAMEFGYRAPPGHTQGDSELRKAALGGVLLPENWGKVAASLSSRLGIHLPETAPAFSSHQQTFRISGPTGPMDIALDKLERLLSPALILLPGRTAAIVPIRRVFTEDLFRLSVEQQSMLSAPETNFRHQRAYFCSPRALRVLSEGTILVFYESSKNGGRSAAFAAARVVRCYESLKSEAGSVSRTHGVLSTRSLAHITSKKTVAVIIFDNIVTFRTPISFGRLQELGCVGPQNLVTAFPIAHESAIALLKEGVVN